MDYWKHWFLERAPFSAHPVAFFSGLQQREAIARLTCMVDGGIQCGLMIAEPGCGMTTLLSHVSRSNGFCDTAAEVVLTDGGLETEVEIWRSLSSGLRSMRTGTAEQDIVDRVRMLTRQGVRFVWLIDGCRESGAKVVRQLLAHSTSACVVVGCSPDNAHAVCVELGQMPLRIELPALDLQDTIRYFHHGIEAATYPWLKRREPVFTDVALVRLHELAGGQMRRIGPLAELAMMLGAANGIQTVDVELLEAVQQEWVRAA